MSATVWNHNIHYYDLVLCSIPVPCRRSLDVGCGAGTLARRLAGYCQEVLAIDSDHDAISRARDASSSRASVTFIEGDVMTHSLPQGGFDFIAAVASLHHLPLRPALARFQSLLNPAGVLVVVGLYRCQSLSDYAWAAAALPTSWALRLTRGHTDVAAPVQEPKESLSEIQEACESLLPGSVFRRRLLFRYSVTWRKP